MILCQEGNLCIKNKAWKNHKNDDKTENCTLTNYTPYMHMYMYEHDL